MSTFSRNLNNIQGVEKNKKSSDNPGHILNALVMVQLTASKTKLIWHSKLAIRILSRVEE